MITALRFYPYRSAPVLIGCLVTIAMGLACFAAEAAPKKKKPGKGGAQAGWEEAIKKFEAADAARPPAKGAVLLVGGSNARRWADVAAYFPLQQVLNRGFGGAKMADVLQYADRIVLPYAPKVILLNAGGNDLSSGKTPEQIRDTARAFIAKVHTTMHETRILCIGVPPVRRAAATPEGLNAIQSTNTLLAELAHTEKNVEFIDLFPTFLDSQGQHRAELFAEDGTHFSPQGYEALAVLLRAKL